MAFLVTIALVNSCEFRVGQEFALQAFVQASAHEAVSEHVI